jgi:glutamate carboxypeptidase
MRASTPLLSLSALLLSFSTALAAPQHETAEKRMISTVEAEKDRTLALLQRMVDQNSGSRNIAGNKAMAAMLTPEFEALGFKVQWLPMEHTGRAGHLVATHPGKGRRLLLIGHIDTVFEPDSPFQRFERQGDFATGPGVSDDKGGIAVMLAALRAMQAAGTLKDAQIVVFLTGDEEDSGAPLSEARKDLIAQGKLADYALDFEGLVTENGQDIGSIARRSVQDWTITVSARSAHSSGVFGSSGDGAIYALSRIIAAMRAEIPEPNLTLNVGLIAGGAQADLAADEAHASAAGKTNIIPAQALARGDLRTLSPEQNAAAVARMQAIVAREYPGAKATLQIGEGYPPMAPTEGNRALLAKLNLVNTALGLPQMGALDPAKRGAGDISFVAADVDSLAGMGPVSSGDHTPGETVDIPSIWRQAKRAALLMSRLAAERK